jgi:serine/threonine protein kinase
LADLTAYTFSLLRQGDLALYRGHGAGLDSILLVSPTEESTSLRSLKCLDHEYSLRTELHSDWAARPVSLTRRNDRVALVLEDPGGQLLDQLVGRPLEALAFLRIAIPLTTALRRVHERGLIHKDIKPGNILVDVASNRIYLTGFGIASRLPSERQLPEPVEVIAGTLAYMAPEQTGRMNRPVDWRSDLYALGVTLYEMLVGVLPFTANDPLEWVHCHIARQPISPKRRVPSVPEQISAIVMKLLSKTAEERYQTAAGVESDFRRCLSEWQKLGRIGHWPLGTHDHSERLLIPEKLYGRGREVDCLLASFDRVVRDGTPELVLVSGYSGIGKSSIVNELHRGLVPPRALFVSGKLDQYARNIPYAALTQAFQSLVRLLLGKDQADIEMWRDELCRALDPNGQLMVNLVPELEFIIGEQSAILDLPPQDAQSRFHLVFRRFLGVCARPEHPLVLFLDDLQWSDTPTLDLIENLLAQPEVKHLLLIGAYRDNEVDSAHPLTRKLERIRKAMATVHEITVAPLKRDDLQQLIADTVHCTAVQAAPLAQLLEEKTAGNPFFVIQFLTNLAEDGLLAFDRRAARWTWDLEQIRGRGFTDNIADLMIDKLGRLPATTQDALKELACLGHRVWQPRL